MIPHRKPLFLIAACLTITALGLSLFHGRGTPPIGAAVPTQASVAQSEQPALSPSRQHPRAVDEASNVAIACNLNEVPVDLKQVSKYEAWNQFKPRRISLPVAGIPITFRNSSIQTQSDGRVIWTGTGEEAPELTLVSVGSLNCYNAIVYAPDCNETHFAIRNGITTVREIDPDSEDVCPQALIPAAEATAPLVHVGELALGDANTADVLYVFTADMMTQYGSAEAAYNDFSARIAAANQMLVDSGVDNLRLRAVGSMQFDYVADGKMNTALSAVTNSATVLAKRQDVYADLVVFQVGEPQDTAGLAWMPTAPSISSTYAVILGVSASTMLHEIAHNFGCNHDRKTAGVADSDTNYNFCHRFTYPDPDTGYIHDAGTIMSYAEYRLSKFSNPNLSFSGNALGIAAGQIGAADNARWLREKASVVASLYSDPNTVLPTITRQPAGASVTVGANLQLSVTATGGALFYQWYKDSTAISGATASSYSVASATAGDAGSYSVTVRNATGTVTSNTVTVSIKPASTLGNPSDTSSGSGGGGGGGAMSPVFIALLALAGWARLGRRARRG